MAPAAIQPVLTSPWCVQNGCTVDKTWALKSGGENWSIKATSDEHAIVEAQTLNGELAGAGLMLTAGGHAAGAATLESLQRYARGIVGDCKGADAYLAKQYAVEREGVMEAPAHRCGPWQMRAAKVSPDFNLSIDRGS